MSCLSCLGANCLDDIANQRNGELYSLNDGSIYFNNEYCFQFGCPDGYICSGVYPRTICIGPGTLPPVVPGLNGFSMKCCQTTIFRSIPRGSSGPQIAAIVQDAYAECARQQAYCDLLHPPPPLPPPRPRNPRPPSNRPSNMEFVGWPGDACIGSTYSATIRVIGGQGAIMTGLQGGTIPPGLFPGSGIDGQSFVLSGTPSQAGTFTFTLTAQDSTGATIQKDFTIMIFGITNLPPSDATEHTAYSYQLTGAGGMAPYTFELFTGGFPGMTISASGLIEGTPDYLTAGDYPFTVEIRDNAGRSCSQTSTIHVGQRPGPDWLAFDWDIYTLGQGVGPPNLTTGSASGRLATANVNYNGVGPPFPGVTPVHAFAPAYTGPAFTVRVIITLASSAATFGDQCFVLYKNGIQQPATRSSGACFSCISVMGNGVCVLEWDLPPGAGDLYTLDDAGPNTFLQLFGVGNPGTASINFVIYNV